MKHTALILLVLWFLSIPAAVPMLLFGLAGNDAANFGLMALGYVLILPSTFLLHRGRRKALVAVILGIALMVAGFMRDQRFWDKENTQLCADLRSDPKCKESPHGFTCINSEKFGNFTTGKPAKCRDTSHDKAISQH